MATLRDHGGAVRYWRDEGGARLVLCGNGAFLVSRAGGRWRGVTRPQEIAEITVDLYNQRRWSIDAGKSARAAVTRTGRAARRQEGV